MDRDELEQALDELAIAVAALDEAERRVIELVAEARNAGATWEQIGEQTGQARQNAQRKYGPLLDERRVVTVRPDEGED